jgi:FkbM family methyltransferase
MKIFGREISGYKGVLFALPAHAWCLMKCLFVLKDPIRFIHAYLTLSGLPSRTVIFRNGLKVGLSDHPHDVVTVFVIFLKRDYGKIPPGSIIVDIGANIGVFSLYAASSRAKKVYSFEPNSESYNRLIRNIRGNGFQGVVEPYRMAVTGKGGEKVKFPRESNVYNAIIEGDDVSDFEMVETTDLQTIVRNKDQMMFLKIDCEGSEYDILLNCNKDAFAHVSFIRMEYHRGKIDEVTSFLEQFGFVKEKHKIWSTVSGIVWYQR